MPHFSIQKEYFQTGATLAADFRIRQLKSLYQAILYFQEEIFEALRQDLSKSKEESYATEIGMVLSEISYAIKHLKHWCRPTKVKTELSQFHAKSCIYPEPYGVVLIIAPWNYPFQLAVSPLVSALAAGNCATIKPSELSPHVSAVLSKLITSCFESRYCAVVEGGISVSTALLEQPYDYIFFTGGERVGKIVMSKAAEHLTPVTLELGGKSPCIVDQTANIPVAAKRIAWGKVLNAGQTCVAPDYILVHHTVSDYLIEELGKSFTQFYGPQPQNNPDYPAIINATHFERLKALLCYGKVRGGWLNESERKIAPAIIEQPQLDSPLMQEEIFGPLLPVVVYGELQEAIQFVSCRPKPLALYLFSESQVVQRQVLSRLSFGGGCINDTISHLVSHQLPFGGVGTSGMGAYHGKAGFDTFTHNKSILSKSTWLDLPVRYPPWDGKLEALRRFLR